MVTINQIGTLEWASNSYQIANVTFHDLPLGIPQFAQSAQPREQAATLCSDDAVCVDSDIDSNTMTLRIESPEQATVDLTVFLIVGRYG
jgi:hypothetical protein